MRLRAVAFAGLAFAAVAGGAVALATVAADRIERRTRADLAAAFATAGQHWAEVRVDGLAVALAGTAPDEASRFRVIEIAHQRVDARRLADAIVVAAPRPVDTPEFALELLRNEDAVSLIGLVPTAGARPAIAEALEAAGLGRAVTDMLETADHPAPDGWHEALGFGVGLLAELPRAQIRVSPGAVGVSAVTASAGDRRALATRLEAAAPPGVALSLDIGAPRPVIAPFAFGLRRDPDGAARLLICSAETEADAEAILAAARRAGASARSDCRIGLGAPSPDWVEAVTAGIAAVEAMGGGTFSLRDLDAILTGPADHDPADLAEVGARLDAALPPVYGLATQGASLVESADGPTTIYAPEFRAILLEDGSVRLAGPVAERTSQIAIVGFAEAVFGHEKVMNTTILDPKLPDGWPGRVLAGIEALALLSEGTLAVTRDSVTVRGSSVVEDAEAEIAAFFEAKGAPPPEVDVAFDPTAVAALAARDAAAAVAAVASDAAGPALPAPVPLPEPAPPVACAEAIDRILAEETIAFESGSATIDDDSLGVVAAIAEVLRGCPGARFEIAGHTDSTGSASGNLALSEARAAAVLAALEAEEDLDVVLAAVGHGAERPIADNDTAEGRARNRRIEFALMPGDAADDGDAAAGADGPTDGDDPT